MTEPHRVDVFFYGLFMDAERLRAKGINPHNSRIASVRDFQLIVGNRATLAPSSGATVYGVLSSLTHSEMDRLYSEPSVSEYRAEAVLALTDAGAVAALCFNLPTAPQPDERNSEYADELKALAERIGLPKMYVDSM